MIHVMLYYILLPIILGDNEIGDPIIYYALKKTLDTISHLTLRIKTLNSTWNLIGLSIQTSFKILKLFIS